MDVNVHPTKHEVIFLHQDHIIAAITDEVERLHQGPVRSVCFYQCTRRRYPSCAGRFLCLLGIDGS